jgi:peptide/nickel transport system permease protein
MIEPTALGAGERAAVLLPADPAEERENNATWSPARKRRRLPYIPIVILGLVVVAAILGGRITGNDPLQGVLSDSLEKPVWKQGGGWDHPLGTDQLGRDVLARLIEGARLTLLVALAGVVLSGVIGSTIGIVAGYRGGIVDSILMRIADVVLAVPVLVLGLALAVIFGRGVANVIFVLAVLTWATYARVVRSEVLKIREMDYVLFARISGVGTWTILRRHVLPNTMNIIIVLLTLQIGSTVIIAASLSFLGLGVPEPYPEWGLMLANSQTFLRLAWWLAVAPGLALASTVLAANLLGDWVRDRLDPHWNVS